MSSTDTKSKSALGFLTVLDHPQYGLFGGYLVLNKAGRPLEFHCTAPIKPNRAQQILYGPTLEAFLYGEQIGRTLLEQAKSVPLVVCTDRLAALTVRDHADLPVILVLAPDGAAENRQDHAEPDDRFGPDGSRLRLDAPHAPSPHLITFQLGHNRVAVPESCADDRRIASERLADLSESFDLVEPFTRIREAIEEAQQAMRT